MIHDALIEYIPGKSVPDSHDFEVGRPPSDFVVSRNIEGKVLSRYGDIAWDLTPYASGDSTHLYFKFWKSGDATTIRYSLVGELHWIMFLLIYRHPARRSTSTGTLYDNLITLRALAVRAESSGISIAGALSDSAFMIATPINHSMCIFKVMAMLQFLGEGATGFNIADGVLPILGDAYKAYVESKKQTAPIPTRIYSSILSRLSEETAKSGAVVDNLVALYRVLRSTPSVLKGREQTPHWGQATFNDLLQEFELEEFWATTGASQSVKGCSMVFNKIQILLSLQIQAYTGMRADEVKNLPWDCIEESRRGGDSRIHYIVNGTTTKLSRGKEKKAQWITIEVAAEAIRTAQKLATAIYDAEGVKLNLVNSRKGSFLLPRNGCDGCDRGLGSTGERPAKLLMTDWIRSILCPVITEEDQHELYLVDPSRSWATEDKFVVGSRWYLQTHQLRRSLALYAQSSGLVSLPSLKRQLQHITAEMSTYYCRGSAFSQNFIGEKAKTQDKHFGSEWQEAQPVSQFLAYAASVLLSDESEIFGGHAAWLKARSHDENGRIFLDRVATLKSFKKGEIAYRSTPLGGCVNPGSCDKNPMIVLSLECLGTDCKHLIANKGNIARMIAAKTNKIRGLKLKDPSCAEIRIEEAELIVLQSGLDRAKSQSMQK